MLAWIRKFYDIYPIFHWATTSHTVGPRAWDPVPTCTYIHITGFSRRPYEHILDLCKPIFKLQWSPAVDLIGPDTKLDMKWLQYTVRICKKFACGAHVLKPAVLGHAAAMIRQLVLILVGPNLIWGRSYRGLYRCIDTESAMGTVPMDFPASMYL